MNSFKSFKPFNRFASFKSLLDRRALVGTNSGPHQLVSLGVFFPPLRRRKFFVHVDFFEFLRQRSDVFARRPEALQSVQGSIACPELAERVQSSTCRPLRKSPPGGRSASIIMFWAMPEDEERGRAGSIIMSPGGDFHVFVIPKTWK
jgi:hypothetical protein